MPSPERDFLCCRWGGEYRTDGGDAPLPIEDLIEVDRFRVFLRHHGGPTLETVGCKCGEKAGRRSESCECPCHESRWIGADAQP